MPGRRTRKRRRIHAATGSISWPFVDKCASPMRHQTFLRLCPSRACLLREAIVPTHAHVTSSSASMTAAHPSTIRAAEGKLSGSTASSRKRNPHSGLVPTTRCSLLQIREAIREPSSSAPVRTSALWHGRVGLRPSTTSISRQWTLMAPTLQLPKAARTRTGRSCGRPD